MSFVFSIKDTYRQAVETMSGGKNTVMYDDKGNPSVMVCIPKFNVNEVIDNGSGSVHPAFLVNGFEKSEIWISKYQNVVHDGRAYSISGVDPRTYIDFDTAKAACEAKGAGWHLMTNAEWAAIALWCRKAGFMPRGNTNYGKSSDATYESGVYAPDREDRCLTGSGPASWNHDGTPYGIADLCGNIWEWVDGLKLINGRIYVHKNNDFNTGNEEGKTDGWVDTEYYFDNTSAGNDETESNNVGGDPILSSNRTYPMYTGGDTNDYFGYSNMLFENLTTESDVLVPDLLKNLAIAPAEAENHGGDYLWVRNYGERVPLRGGTWHYGSSTGVFALYLSLLRSYSHSHLGFRAAFCSL